MARNCPNCGKTLKEGYVFCGKCGYEIPKVVKEEHEEYKKVEDLVKSKPTSSLQEEDESTITVDYGKSPKKNRAWTVLAFLVIVTIIIAIVFYYNALSSSSNDSLILENIKIDDNSNNFPIVVDSDGDGYPDGNDDFPYDPSEWRDNDNDGYGDNSDAFPYDYTEHLDSDGDGIGDNTDWFPYDPDETKDSDNDGMGDNADIDDDNDGYPDHEDYLPYDDAQIRIDLIEFIVKDEVDGWPDDGSKAQIYFEIYVNDEKIARSPQEGYAWEADIGITKTINWYSTFNIPDNSQSHTISIRMYDSDAIFNDQLDIDGNDDTKGCTITYDIVTGTWTGDDTDGITDGSYDGTQYSDDDDAYLEYDVSNV